MIRLVRLIRIVKLYKNANYVLHENEKKENVPEIKEEIKAPRRKSIVQEETQIKQIGSKSNKVMPSSLKRGSVASENILGQMS